VQPVGAVIKTPLQPAGPFVELTNENKKLVGRGIDPGGEIDDGFVQLIDGEVAVGDVGERGHGVFLDWVAGKLVLYPVFHLTSTT